MKIKWKIVAVDSVVVLFVSILVAVIVNELRKDRIPMLPAYMNNGSYQEMQLTTFQQEEYKNYRCFIFDARPHESYNKNHLEQAVNFPPSNFDFFYQLHLSDAPPNIPIFVYGRTLSRVYDKELAYRLSLMGHKNVTVIF